MVPVDTTPDPTSRGTKRTPSPETSHDNPRLPCTSNTHQRLSARLRHAVLLKPAHHTHLQACLCFQKIAGAKTTTTGHTFSSRRTCQPSQHHGTAGLKTTKASQPLVSLPLHRSPHRQWHRPVVRRTKEHTGQATQAVQAVGGNTPKPSRGEGRRQQRSCTPPVRDSGRASQQHHLEQSPPPPLLHRQVMRLAFEMTEEEHDPHSNRAFKPPTPFWDPPPPISI